MCNSSQINERWMDERIVFNKWNKSENDQIAEFNSFLFV